MVPEGGADIETAAGVSKLSGRLLKKRVLEAIEFDSIYEICRAPEKEQIPHDKTVRMTTLLEFFNSLLEKGRLKFL